MKKKDPLRFCADQIDVITNFAVITNVVIKRVHCTDTCTSFSLRYSGSWTGLFTQTMP